MMATGEQTNVEIAQSLSSAEVAIDSFLQEPVLPRKSSPLKYWQQKKVLYPTVYWQRWPLRTYLFLLLQLLLNVYSAELQILLLISEIV